MISFPMILKTNHNMKNKLLVVALSNSGLATAVAVTMETT